MQVNMHMALAECELERTERNTFCHCIRYCAWACPLKPRGLSKSPANRLGPMSPTSRTDFHNLRTPQKLALANSPMSPMSPMSRRCGRCRGNRSTISALSKSHQSEISTSATASATASAPYRPASLLLRKCERGRQHLIRRITINEHKPVIRVVAQLVRCQLIVLQSSPFPRHPLQI